ncbi:MAG: hypothetical protein JWN78_839 [Bacteroidota bacterium]|nr:hypothetical protein [Bacteroidota bacterium]
MTKSRLPVTILAILFCAGCSSTNLKTYTNPAFTRDAVKTLALLPMRNIAMTPSEATEINRFFYAELVKKNGGKAIIDPLESTKRINDLNLVPTYDQFLREFENTGVPNSNTLKVLGAQLHCDAIVQGVIQNFRQTDGRIRGAGASTNATLRYMIISTTTGDILWEASCAVTKSNTTVHRPPPLFDLLLNAEKKIVTAIPKL